MDLYVPNGAMTASTQDSSQQSCLLMSICYQVPPPRCIRIGLRRQQLGSDGTSLPSLGHKRHCGFCITPLGVLSWRKPAAMFWGHSGSPRRGPLGKGWRPPVKSQWGTEAFCRQPQDESILEASLQSHQAFSGPRLWGMPTTTLWDPDPEPPAKLPLGSWLSENENKCLRI